MDKAILYIDACAGEKMCCLLGAWELGARLREPALPLGLEEDFVAGVMSWGGHYCGVGVSPCWCWRVDIWFSLPARDDICLYCRLNCRDDK